MKINRVFVIFIFTILFCKTSSGQAIENNSLEKEIKARLIICSGLSEKKIPLDNLENININEGEKIYFYIKWFNLSKSNYITSIDILDVDNNYLAQSSKHKFKAKRRTKNSWNSRTFREIIIPEGIVKIRVVLDDKIILEKKISVKYIKDINPKIKVELNTQTEEISQYPSDVIPFMKQWKILLGDGTHVEDLVNYQKKDFFYVENENETNWVVYKTPNSGITSRTSSNTRTELGQIEHWIPEVGGRLTGTLKVQHVSTTGDARAASSYSVVIGQIHSDEGHENEPLKIYYKKFPGHTKGSVFWNYEINTEGDNSGRFDFSTAVWGHDFSVVGTSPDTYPKEPENGIALGEEFSYEVNIYKGIMYLTFTSEGHETIKLTKSLIKSDFAKREDIPEQVLKVYANRDKGGGVEREIAYAGEINYFKQGAYNQANAKSTKSEIYGGDIAKQYANGSYAEVWFKQATVGSGTLPNKE